MKSAFLAIVVASTFAAATGQAAILHTTTTPAGAVALIGSGATVVDFESFAPADYPSVTSNGLTVTPNNGHEFVDGAYAGSFNNFGRISLHNCYCGDSFGSLTMTLSAPSTGFGFFFGASDVAWTLTTFDALGNMVDTASIGPTYGSNAGDFYYTLATIKSATLVGSASDYIFIDNVTFNGGTVPEPASWAMLIAGFGLVGAAARRRRSAAVSA